MRIGVLVSVLVVIGFSLQAQDRDQVRLQEHLLLKDGTVLQIRDQDQTSLRDKLTLLDGTVINADGTYTDGFGVQQRLRDGECIDMDGNWYASQVQLHQNLQARTQASEQLHYFMRDGYVFRMENQRQNQLREQASLQDGGYINPDGSFRLRDQQLMRLRDGECLDPEGNYYGNEAQFRKQALLRLQAMSQEHFVYSNNQMFRVQNRVQSQLNQQFTTENGMVVFPDGSVLLPDRDRDRDRDRDMDRDRIRLHDGECLDADGNIYVSQLQLREQAQLHLQAMNQEHFVLEGGQLYQVRNQQPVQVREQLALHSGLMVFPDGVFKMQDRQRDRLSNGECLDMDGNRYRTQIQFHNEMQQRLQAMSEPHFSFENGTVWRNNNQVRSPLKENWTLQNGAVVKPDGTFQLKNGKQTKMRNGEFLDWEGKRYDNRDRFREKMELRMRDRMEMRDREMIERRRATEPGRRVGSM